ncbi:MAG: hypothetical protein PHG66_02565 [Candidatus Colwellbacteria bacterium]|nr:hypothetical protein [Candidatus Colwellbacteria bacterium]
MYRPLSIEGLEPAMIPIFIASLLPEERESLFRGEERFFSDPLNRALKRLEDERDWQTFMDELLAPLETEEKKVLLGCKAFNCLPEGKAFKMQLTISR